MDTTLEMQIKTTGQEALKVLRELNSSITGLVTTLNKIQGSTSGIENLGKASEKTLGKVDKLSTSFNKLFSAVAGKKFAMKALDFLDSASNRAEELNLFNVIFKNVRKNGEQTFSDLGLEATRFQHKLNEAFGTNMTETLRYQGLFQAMATNQGIGEKYAAIMSENMVKLTYDLASLYNRSEKTTAEALRAGVYAGMTKPLRGFGLDVTEKSLKNILPSLGITDRTVSDMNQAEKEILRYISTLNQAKSAMGDFAETIESPANQVKIFKQQLVEAKTALGNLFMAVYSEVLPYANAFLMLVKEVAQALAGIFGIETGDYNSGLASTEEIYDGIAEGAGNAAKSAKELKRQLLKFDEVNNITTPKASGSGSGSGLSNGGIDKRLLDAIKGYDNLMSKVRMKATEIRDRWMEILGFKKVINPLTGEIEFKYQGFGTTLKNIWKAFLDLNPQAKLFTAIIGGLTVGKIVTGITKLSKALGTTGLLKSITGLFTPLKTMTGYTKTYWNLIGDAEKGTKKLKSALSEGVDAWYKSATGVEKLKTGIKGLVANLSGMALVSASLDDISRNGANLLNVAEGLGGAFSTIAGAIQIGASIGGSTGAIVGGVVGSLEVLITAISSYKNEYTLLMENIDKKAQETIDMHKKLREEMEMELQVPDTYENLLKELDTLVDKNGKIKQGYEDRVKFIATKLKEAYGIELEISNGNVKNYQKQIDKIKELIETQKREIKLKYAKQGYEYAQGNIDTSYSELINAQDELDKTQNKLKDLQKEWDWWFTTKYGDHGSAPAGKLQELQIEISKTKSDIEKGKTTVEKATKSYEDNVAAITNYEGMVVANSENNAKAFDYYAMQQEMASNRSKNTFGKNLAEQIQMGQAYYDEVIKQAKDNEQEITDTVKASAEQRLNTVISVLTDSKNYVNGVSKEQADAWGKLGQLNESKFLEAFKKLPSDVQQNVVNKMQSEGYKISNELQKGINKINPKITIDANVKTTSVKKQIKELLVAAGLPVPPLFKEQGGIFNGKTWSSIPQYANGGVPSHGTLFAAGENGAEIVGNINRRTEVLNRSQIASAIYSAVVSAMSQFNGGSSQIDVHVHTDEGTVVDRINQKTKQTGVCPINIPSY